MSVKREKRVVALLLVLMMVLYLVNGGNLHSVKAAEFPEYYSVSDGKEKTEILSENDVYIIDSADELAWLASAVNSNVDFGGKTVVITGNFDLKYPCKFVEEE